MRALAIMTPETPNIYQTLLTVAAWAFSFWMVADSFRRRKSFWWVVVILLVSPPIGGLIYFTYIKLSERRRARLGGEFSAGRAGNIEPPGGEPERMLDVADQLEQHERFGEALMIYRRALEHSADNPRALHGLARCQVELDRADSAVETYEALMTLDPRYRNYTAALEYAEALHRAGRNADAAGLLEGMVQETGRLNHRLALAHYYEQSGQTARAESVLKDALTAYEQSPAPERQANRRWQRLIVSKLEELTAS